MTAGGPRVLAIDWSGARTGSARKIWIAEAAGHRLLRLENGRGREQVAEHLLAEATRDAHMVVGLDFAFSLPAWFVERLGRGGAPGLWTRAGDEGDDWLARCRPPFWGRRGTCVPRDVVLLRRTEEALRSGAVAPKSPFQIAGAGSVGTGSIRGMPMLARLRARGFSIWPFDPPGWPRVVEIYPRLFTPGVRKSRPTERAAFLRRFRGAIGGRLRRVANGCDDAFDAAVAALAMAAHVAELASLGPARDAQELLEGRIWTPRGCRHPPNTLPGARPSVRTRRCWMSHRSPCRTRRSR